ncbi:DUF7093 family protein [Halorhabdus amylolytica]|uniref:DUF7093 family protein n=1 Tax=Halorhabdus amylolytica TaxID=2559573 RepID=UPI0010AA2C6B|nr:hypothetical protein [Halorhabdus amylolytica]
MGIKCSLFGHAYGETAVERDREEQGSEVIITIREVETCQRCGETRVVSENKEVTTIETPEEVSPSGGSEEAAVTPGDEDSTEGPSAPTTETSVGAEIVDAEDGQAVTTDEPSDADADGADGPASERMPPASGEGNGDESPPPVEDDGVILEDDDEPDRDPGEWPEETEADASDREHTPSRTDGIERFTDDSSTKSGDEAVESTGRGQPSTDDPSGDVPSDAGDNAEASDAGPIDRADESEVWSKADPDLDADRSGATVTVPEGKFRCPECEFTTPVDSSSLREGDFCPECHQGTLVHESG